MLARDFSDVIAQIIEFVAVIELQLIRRNKHTDIKAPVLSVPRAELGHELRPAHLLLNMRPSPVRLLAAHIELIEGVEIVVGCVKRNLCVI